VGVSFFDADTGIITAKYEQSTKQPHPKGVHTVDPAVLPLNIEAVTEGRLRTRRNLLRAVRHLLAQIQMRSNAEEAALVDETLEAVRDNDEYGLADWYFRRDGGAEEPFRTLRDSYRGIWDRLAQAI
jgi:hypothetical protein